MSSSKNQFYTNKSIKYLVNKYIAEFDIQRAGLNSLHKLGVISDDTYNTWRRLPKSLVSIYIGKHLSKHIPDQNIKIGNAVDEFIKSNNILESNIISKKRDALFTFNIRPTVTEIDGFTFICKNAYTSYFSIENAFELYYNGNTDTLDIKGIDTTWIQNHMLVPYIQRCIKKYEALSKGFCSYAELYTFIFNLRKDYVSFKLPIGCYREIAYGNPYCFSHSDNNTIMYFQDFPENDLDNYKLVTTYNYNRFIVPFINILPQFRPEGVNNVKGKAYAKR